MDIATFLRHIWLDGPGHFCLAVPGETGFNHRVFDTIAAAAIEAAKLAPTKDVFCNVHTLKQPQVWDAKKVRKDGSLGGWRVRVGTNMRGCRCIFGDVDVGDDKPYRDQAAALAALADFLAVTGLPRPTVVSSGRGLHIYWVFDRELEVEAWRILAKSFKLLAAKCSFHIDPARTTDVSSVLRVAGTKHHKDPANIRNVEVLGDLSEIIPVERFMHLVDQANANTLEVALSASNDNLFPVDLANLPKGEVPEWYSDPPSMADLGKACPQFRYACSPDQLRNTPEPVWYFVQLNLSRWTKEGREACHAISMRHVDYTPEATDAKIIQLEGAAGARVGPSTCGKVADIMGVERCLSCRFKGHDLSSPIAHARHLPKEKSKEEQELGIPDPPKPYTRLGKGGIRYSPIDGDAPRIIFEYDLYPLRLIHNEEDKKTETLWAVAPPLRGIREFQVQADVYSDVRKLEGLLRNMGIFTHYENYKYLREYMSAYIALLQQHVRDSKQYTHLGWTKGYVSFILPDRIITAGISAPVALNDNVIAASTAIGKQGTLEKQIELLRFYARPEYARHQFFAACGLASVLLHATGHHGVLVNMAGSSGASKSTALYTAASFWGDPEPYSINGTIDGATIRARNERLLLMSNLPVCVDEITRMSTDDASNLAFSITQEGGRIRLKQDSTERKKVAAQKSTFMLTTSNKSLHELLSAGNAEGTASSMRVFEIMTPPVGVHTKREADDYMRGLRANFGHIGPLWIEHVTKHRDRLADEVVQMQRDVDEAGNVAPHERFWSSTMAVVLVTVREAFKIGLLPFSFQDVYDFVMSQLATMRATVSANYIDPVDSLLGYIAANITNLLLVTTDAKGTTLVRAPMRELVGRYETNTKLLFITHKALAAYCTRQGVSLTAMIAELRKQKIGAPDRISVGRGIPQYNVGQHAVLRIDMRHPALAGVALEDGEDEASNVVSINSARKP